MKYIVVVLKTKQKTKILLLQYYFYLNFHANFSEACIVLLCIVKQQLYSAEETAAVQ